ncbi:MULTISPECIES: GatB/YqeY domain-containing protein [unclassified Bosea (in: a-proteobacteria)]|uniref:GatB/YqeY domain-containing protein n=1 Tax=unclassified Bosea (in: a-proteobacteria) TaxID=2653178 RepID=UPI000F76074B|nr:MULTISPECIES: GatB/YqeY domain-containing protein [unclassified Bosea (in: a-proteobacteria)]AZO82142.1 hypothetical protein BLM15_30650 [Bosea sp. Tri-49]RXT20710.1 hypothetical protein B5U98_18135 [Bosea sp. Tri-39]RXT33741.1 hypothetical protein B5U99_18315 [Bosea sp. Tri-54]
MAASMMKARLSADLRHALKEKDRPRAALLRSLLAALDNAEAPPATASPVSGQDFRSGAAEVERLVLDDRDVQRILVAEIEEREGAAAQFERMRQAQRAADLRFEATLARQYLK